MLAVNALENVLSYIIFKRLITNDATKAMDNIPAVVMKTHAPELAAPLTGCCNTFKQWQQSNNMANCPGYVLPTKRKANPMWAPASKSNHSQSVK